MTARNKAPGLPFTRGRDARRGRGPVRGAANAGRPASAVKKALATRLTDSLFDRVAILEQIADGAVPIRETCPRCGFTPAPDVQATQRATIPDRLRALDIMARIGLEDEGTVSPAELRRCLASTIGAIREALPTAASENLIATLRLIWTSPGR